MLSLQRHPLGFFKITLLSLLGFKLRLHIWPRSRRRVGPGRHDHRWWFVSLPLWGVFEEFRYSQTEGSDLERVECFPATDYREQEKVVAGTSGLREIRRYIRRPLVPYRCRQGEIHSLAPKGTGFAMTLVWTGRPQRNSALAWMERQ